VTALLALLNVLMGLVVFGLEMFAYIRVKDTGRWILLLYSLVGLYWSGLYGYIFVARAENAGALGPLLIRPGFTVTLAVIAAGAIWRLRTTRGKK
jgi:hypothetical protein